jgi:hypothetical protein
MSFACASEWDGSKRRQLFQAVESEAELSSPRWCQKSQDLDTKRARAVAQEAEVRAHHQALRQQRALVAAALENKKASVQEACAAATDRRWKLQAAMAATRLRQVELNAPAIANSGGAYEDEEEDLIDRFFCRQFLSSDLPPYICFLDLKPEDTIDNLKAKLQTMMGVPSSDMAIVHSGCRLAEQHKLCCLGLFEETVVHVVKAPAAAALKTSVVLPLRQGGSGCSLECQELQRLRVTDVCSCCGSSFRGCS